MTLPMREVETMTCMTCGQQKARRDGFPNTMFAECWACAWKHHVEAEHKPKKPKALTKAGRIKALSNENTRLRLDLSRFEITQHPESGDSRPDA